MPKVWWGGRNILPKYGLLCDVHILRLLVLDVDKLGKDAVHQKILKLRSGVRLMVKEDWVWVWQEGPARVYLPRISLHTVTTVTLRSSYFEISWHKLFCLFHFTSPFKLRKLINCLQWLSCSWFNINICSVVNLYFLDSD